MPAADDLFRRTGETTPVRAVPDAPDPGGEETGVPVDGAHQAGGPGETPPDKRPSGRVRHDEKMTVYVTSEELLDLEQVRLALRREHGLAVDRGRLVREAVGMVLADFERHGDDSALVRRLSTGG